MAISGQQLNNIAGGAALAVGTYNVVKALATARSGKAATPPDLNWDSMPMKDLRAKLTVPLNYLESYLTQGPLLELGAELGNGGILFPYTPEISFDETAAWTAQSLTHSNFNFYSYKNSAVSSINLSAKFTVQTDQDAGNYLAMTHLLRALTKMPVGLDTNAGSPPPVCRLSAYGQYMLSQIPVVVASFKTQLPSDVDYFMTTDKPNSKTPSNSKSKLYTEYTTYKTFQSNNHMIPVSSTISLTLIPVYSRYEQYNFGVDKWLKGTLAGKGYL
jgi:hypothetical protein